MHALPEQFAESKEFPHVLRIGQSPRPEEPAAIIAAAALFKKMSLKSHSRSWFLVFVFLVALLLRVGVAMRVPSLAHPDEIFQTQEPAHRLAYGYGIITWEWRDGIRSWAFPAFLAVVMRATGWMGAGSTGYLWATLILLSLISLATVWFGFAWAKRAGGIPAAMIAAGGCAIWYELVIFSPRALTEVLAAHILLPGLYLGAYADGRWEKRKLFLAGLLCGLAMSLRIQLFPAVVVAALYFCRSRWRARIPAVLGGLLLPLSTFGLVDAITWSYPFQSFFRYFWVNAVEGRSTLYGAEPWYWYLAILLAHLGPILFLALLGLRRSPFLGWMALAILAPHSFLPHKEVRFIYPLIPILITLAALGTVELAKELGHFLKFRFSPRITVSVALVLFALFSTLLAPQFTYWNSNSGAMAMMDQLSRDPSVCGLGVLGISWFNTGGYTHLHRNVPMVLLSQGSWIDQQSSSINAVIAYGTGPSLTRDFALKECSDGVCLYQRTGACESPKTAEVNAVLRQTGN
ncbi:MAG TPA: mannosyltransferase [Candidatus Angelobacter sp.]